MKALRRLGIDHADVRDVERPTPRLGQVRLRIAAASLCQSDVHMLHDPVSAGAVPPVTLGHEIAGHIEELGTGVTGRGNTACLDRV